MDQKWKIGVVPRELKGEEMGGSSVDESQALANTKLTIMLTFIMILFQFLIFFHSLEFTA